MSSQIGGELIGQGSFGCVFKPSIRCIGDNSDNNDNNVSKIFVNREGQKELIGEYNININIKKIKGYQIWSNIWFKKCKPPEYDEFYKIDPDIEDCLNENNVSNRDYDEVRGMLLGDYGGETINDYMYRLFPKKVFSSNKEFKNKFLKIMKEMKPLFIGLKSLYINKIGHNDIKEDNILINNEGCKLIDFGFTCKYREKKNFKRRSSLEFLTDRIYPAYPYEFIYLYATPDILKELDKSDLNFDVNRSLHDRYEYVHKYFFNREVKNYLINLVDTFIINVPNIRKKYGKQIISLLDTYSLGIVIPNILCKLARKYNTMKQLKKHIHNKVIKSFIDLFKHMTEPDAFNRMNPIDVYDKFLELEELYLTKKTISKKRTKRKD
jgi:serine/threonine protein kinase